MGHLTYLSVHVCEPPPEGARRQAAEPDIRAQDGGAGNQGVGGRLWFFKLAHPPLKKKKKKNIWQVYIVIDISN